MKKQKQSASERGITTVQDHVATEIFLIRHAPVIRDGRVYGRRDIAADCSDCGHFARLRSALPTMDRVLCSPAQRCIKTSAAIWPDAKPVLEPALWEQDLGDWEGQPYADLPELGPMNGLDLASFAPPNGESFQDVCARVDPVLAALPPGKTAFVAHAGSIRAALSVALGGVPTALRFDIANLSVTRLTKLQGGVFCINDVNRCI